MQEAGKKFRYLVQFTSGQPTSDLTYTLYNQDRDVVLTETLPVVTGQLSYLIEIPAGSNTLSKPLFEQMELEWEYTTAAEAVTDSIKYTIHLPVGFPAGHDGVRSLLGVDRDEVSDEEIDLFAGFIEFQRILGTEVDLSTYLDTGDYNNYQITKAIEAAAALRLLPSLQLRLPRKYDSGTSLYERWNNIDWLGLQADLNDKIAAAVLVVVPDFEYWPTIDIFGLSTVGTDPITGE